MQDIFTRLRSIRPLRYIFIGGISYVIELSFLLFLANVLSFSPELAVAFSFWVGLIISFTLQKYIAFSNTTKGRGAFSKQAVPYGALVLFNYVFTIISVSLLVNFLQLEIARTIALIVTTFWNYFVYKKIFKTPS